jgi:hypothetical protein
MEEFRKLKIGQQFNTKLFRGEKVSGTDYKIIVCQSRPDFVGQIRNQISLCNLEIIPLEKVTS